MYNKMLIKFDIVEIPVVIKMLLNILQDISLLSEINNAS